MTLIEKIEQNLEYIMMRYPDSKLKESVSYSLIGGGKRIRAQVAYLLAEALGAEADNYMDFYCAIEMVHAYSLVHDDLPILDNDDIRRGKPSNHIKFGDSTALLAGDALLTEAFHIISSGAGLSAEEKMSLITILASNAGLDGVCQGQMMDLEKQTTKEEVLNTHAYKTATMFVVPTGFARVIGKSSQMNEISQFGYNLGMLFQVVDDLDDNDGLVTVCGVEETLKLKEEYKTKTLEALAAIDGDTSKLEAIVAKVVA